MTIIEKINKFLKKKFNLFSINSPKALQIQDLKPIILISFMIIFSGVFFISYNLIHKKNKDNINHFKEITENNEFSNLANFFISKIRYSCTKPDIPNALKRRYAAASASSAP